LSPLPVGFWDVNTAQRTVRHRTRTPAKYGCREMAPNECALALSGTGFTFIADGEPDKAQG